MLRKKQLERKVFGNVSGNPGINPHGQPRSNLTTLGMKRLPRWLGTMALLERLFLLRRSGQPYLPRITHNPMLRPSSMSSERVAKALWGSPLQARTTRLDRTRKRCPYPLREVSRFLHGQKRAAYSLFSSLEAARSLGLPLRHLLNRKTNPRWCCQRRRQSERHVAVRISDDLQSSRAVVHFSPNRKRPSDDSRIHQVSCHNHGLTPMMTGKTMRKVLARVMMRY